MRSLSKTFKLEPVRDILSTRSATDVTELTVRTPRGGATISRMAALHAGLPESCSVSTVNRQCSSSLQAVWTIANQIAQGDIDVGIAAGVESMSQHYTNKVLDHPISETVQQHQGVCSDKATR